ncbi:MAG: DUF4214 domain-containing protein [Pannonibacter sp.]
MATADTIKQYFVNILQRDPTATESAQWTALVDSSALTLAQVRDSIASSNEAKVYVDQIIRIYQAAFGRKPDVTGINGWTDDLRADATALSMIAAGFVNSTEWKNRYGDNTVNDAVLQGLYQNVLGRTGSAEEITAWKATGQSMSQILIGFSNSAEFAAKAAPAILALKQAAGDVATSALNTVFTGSGALFDPAAGTGQTYVLTTGVDNFVGTAGNDTFRATDKEISAADNINGAGGTDKFDIFLDGGNMAPLTAASVEQFFIQASVAARTADFNNVTGVKEIWNNGSSQNLTIDNVKELVAVGVKGNIGNTLYNVKFADSLTSGANDSVTIALDGATSTLNPIRVGGVTAANEFENITFSVAGTNKIQGLERTDGVALAGTKSVTITGAGNLEVVNALATKLIDGSKATGDLKLVNSTADVVVTTGSGKDTVTLGHVDGVNAISDKVKVDLGAGDDKLVLSFLNAATNIQNGASLKGGAGVNTLSVRGDFAASMSTLTAADASKKGIEGFTKLEVGNTTGNINAARLGTIDQVTFFGTANHTLSGIASGSTVQFNAPNAVNTLTASVTGAADAGSNSDVLNVVLKGTHAAATIDYGTVTAANVETINVNSTTAKTTALVAADTNTVNLTVANAQTITVTGEAKVILTGAALNGASLSSIDAAANTGGIEVSSAGAAQGIKITGTAKADVITGGNGNDIIIAGAGNDTVRGGQGNDVLDLAGGGSNTIRFETTGALNGKDTVKGFNVGAVADGGDVLTVTDFNGIAAPTTVVIPNLIGGLQLGDNTINVINFNAAIASKDFGGADFGDLFGGGKAFSTTTAAGGAQAILAVQGTDSTQIYLVNSEISAAADITIDANEVILIGVLEGVTNANTFVGANFA